MTDSPAYRLPLDPQEQPILDKLLNIRDHLSILKQDRSSYVKSQDVFKFYDQLIEQVSTLNTIRVNKRDEQNRVDTVLDDCFQLISLFFLTIGRNSEAPAVYSAVSTVKRLLDHLREAGFYSSKDLESISQHIEEWQASVERGKDSHAEHLLTLLDARIDVCKATLQELQDRLSRLDPQMMGRYEKLVSILRSLSASNTRSRVRILCNHPCDSDELIMCSFRQKKSTSSSSRLSRYSRRWRQTPTSTRGRARSKHTQTSCPSSVSRKARCRMAEQSCWHCSPAAPCGLRSYERSTSSIRITYFVANSSFRQGKIDERFQETYDKLVKIKNTLEQMNLTQAWSLRETDLYSYQRQLDRIDEARVNGNFIDAEGRPADLHAQRTLLYLLRKSYAFIYQYIISSEPVSEALLPIYNQLLTLKRCLKEVKKAGGVDSPRELYPYSMKLNSIDNMRKDGKFMVGNDIPEGQASVTALLSECFELAYELRNDAEENGEDTEKEKEQFDAELNKENTNGVAMET
jgi:hypothetical protein